MKRKCDPTKFYAFITANKWNTLVNMGTSEKGLEARDKGISKAKCNRYPDTEYPQCLFLFSIFIFFVMRKMPSFLV